MYEDETYSINWVKIILRVIIAFLVIILSIKLIYLIKDKNKSGKGPDNATYVTKENLNLMDKYARDTFTDKDLAKVVGSSKSLSVSEVMKNGGLKEFEEMKDSCDFDSSYVEGVRLEKEIQYTSYLICGAESDSFISYSGTSAATTTKASTTKATTTTTIAKPTTTKASTTAVSTTKAITTTKATTKAVKKYSIKFNTNGGLDLASVKVVAGNTTKLPTPTRHGYVFLGWYCSGSKVTNNTKINKDMVLVAKWREA